MAEEMTEEAIRAWIKKAVPEAQEWQISYAVALITGEARVTVPVVHPIGIGKSMVQRIVEKWFSR